MTRRLEEKVAVIVGGTRGIGKGIAQLFAAHGAKVLITGRNQVDLDKVASEIPDILTMKADTTQSTQTEKVISFMVKEFGRIDILCHNAGVAPVTLLADMTEAGWDEVCNTNLKGTFLSVKACLPVMEAQAYGRIVVISAITGPKIAMPGLAHYGASKAGVNGFIKSVALEVARKGITVNGIEPGNIMTDKLMAEPCQNIEALRESIPMGELGNVYDVAYAALFLASDEARYITGETIVVDGGKVLPSG